MTVKKWIALAIALILAFATVACTANDATSDTDAPVPEETEAPAETAAPEQPQSGNPDVSGAVDASTTTETSAVPLGQWAKTARYATEDDTYHTVYVRLNKVTTASQDEAYVQSAIELHNSCSSDFRQIDVSTFNLPDDVELCVLDYEAFPRRTVRASTSGWAPIRRTWRSPKTPRTSRAIPMPSAACSRW